jgi:hypothetical protein
MSVWIIAILPESQCVKQSKVVLLDARQALRGRGHITPTHSSPRH